MPVCFGAGGEGDFAHGEAVLWKPRDSHSEPPYLRLFEIYAREEDVRVRGPVY